jgi:hypothetical protein
MPRGFNFIHKIFQTRVHQAAAGPNPEAKEKKNKNILDTTGTGSAQGLQFHLQ